ncbi:SigB/SigF/SigG family RNA polymerase sigma factor [Nocardioides sp. W3-2-3]|uniref:SigB/SigF/SigG family RNA polymerase sigma factor n=1 Tax=Nocardioides convexus TaxID=2712224 RepID=UPI0024188005|nr:SigB/SigF/SigG family RNA polymerase sigma factor [Nocardioides convexus]NHA00095.1 SigB/SigF/SigG family RNA polymerase sigma factor [Nocardioides convexus]
MTADTSREDRRASSVEETRRRSAALFVVLRDEDVSSAERDTARDALVHLHLPLVEHCARRFRNRGEPYEDLVQVGTIGLIKSVDRFDTERGVEFSTYATPTIIGEIKRYFRDKGWAIRVPRRLQEPAHADQRLHRRVSPRAWAAPPPRARLAEAIGCSVEEIVEGPESSNAYSTLSLDATDDDSDGGAGQSMLDAMGVDDEALEHVEIRESVKPLLENLPPREKKILLLRFFKNMTQSQIAEEIGVSQMHVSRLLSRTLEQAPSVAGVRGLISLVAHGRVPVERLEGVGVQHPREHDQRADQQRDRDHDVLAHVPGQPQHDQPG